MVSFQDGASLSVVYWPLEVSCKFKLSFLMKSQCYKMLKSMWVILWLGLFPIWHNKWIAIHFQCIQFAWYLKISALRYLQETWQSQLWLSCPQSSTQVKCNSLCRESKWPKIYKVESWGDCKRYGKVGFAVWYTQDFDLNKLRLTWFSKLLQES